MFLFLCCYFGKSSCLFDFSLMWGGIKMGLFLHTAKFSFFMSDVYFNMSTLLCYTGCCAESPIFCDTSN